MTFSSCTIPCVALVERTLMRQNSKVWDQKPADRASSSSPHQVLVQCFGRVLQNTTITEHVRNNRRFLKSHIHH